MHFWHCLHNLHFLHFWHCWHYLHYWNCFTLLKQWHVCLHIVGSVMERIFFLEDVTFFENSRADYDHFLHARPWKDRALTPHIKYSTLKPLANKYVIWGFLQKFCLFVIISLQEICISYSVNCLLCLSHLLNLSVAYSETSITSYCHLTVEYSITISAILRQILTPSPPRGRGVFPAPPHRSWPCPSPPRPAPWKE